MIKLPAVFDRKSLRHLSTVDCGEEILANTTSYEFRKCELSKLVAEKIGISPESASGSLWGCDIYPLTHKIMGRKSVKENWIRSKSGNIVKIGSIAYNPKEVLNLSYDTEGKQLARAEGPEWCLRKLGKRPVNILTMAGAEGHDVKRFLEINPMSRIDNVEKNRNIFEAIAEKNFPNMDNHCSDMRSFLIDNTDKFFDVINFDSDGYVSQSLDNTLKVIDEYQMADFVCLTIQNLKNFRNTGEFIIALRRKYAGYDDPTKEYIENDVLFNYDIVKDFVYNRGQEGTKSVDMWTIIFKLRKDLC